MDTKQTEYLPRTLSDEELRSRADDLARTMHEVDEEEIRKGAAAKASTTRIKKLRADAGTLAREIRERKTYSQIEVDTIRNLEDCTIDTIRMDTREIVRSRPMTPDERQVRIDDHPKRKSKAKSSEAKPE